MKKLFLLFLSGIIITGFSVITKSYESKMDTFKWMVGSWKMETKRGAIMETWISVNDSSLAGESFMVRITGGTTILEKIQLVSRGNEYFYIPVAQGQNDNGPVKFKITSFNESGFVAENPEHDFPKRITYKLVNKDSVHAFIDGGPATPEKKSDFYYSRQKN
jgi:hypothetical protein